MCFCTDRNIKKDSNIWQKGKCNFVLECFLLGPHESIIYLPSQAGYIKRWSQELKAHLWSWRSAGLFSPVTPWTITNHQSGVPPNWELWSSIVSAPWCSLMRRSSRTLVSSQSALFSVCFSGFLQGVNLITSCLFHPGYWNIIVHGRKHSYRLYTKMLNEAMRWANAIQGAIDSKVPIETPTQQLIRDIKVLKHWLDCSSLCFNPVDNIMPTNNWLSVCCCMAVIFHAARV